MDNPNISVTQNVDKVESGGTVIGVQVVYQGEPVTIPSREAIRLHRADLANIETYHRWADEFYIHEEGKVLPLFASPYEDDGGRKRADLLQTIRAHSRLLVLGEPGMGKTVALERMGWETAKADEVVVPIFVQLLYFQGLELIELIRVALNETGRLTFDNAKSVRAFLRETKCLILFDGLNETPGKQREQVIGAIANFMREYPEHRYVVTSRSQDELWRKLRSAELIQDAVVVQTISDAQAQGYLQAHLGTEKGAALYDRLDASLKALARTQCAFAGIVVRRDISAIQEDKERITSFSIALQQVGSQSAEPAFQQLIQFLLDERYLPLVSSCCHLRSPIARMNCLAE